MKRISYFLFSLFGLFCFSSCGPDFDDLQYKDTEEGLYVYQDEQPFSGQVSCKNGRIKMEVENGVSKGVAFFNRRGKLSIVYRGNKTRTYYNEKGEEIDRSLYHHLYAKDLDEMTDNLYYFNNILKSHSKQP